MKAEPRARTPRVLARRLVALGLALGLGVYACGTSSAPQYPVGSAGPRSPTSNGSLGFLAAGLSSNLEKLDSYRFTETNAGQPAASIALPAIQAATPAPPTPALSAAGTSSVVPAAGGGSYAISGIVINKPMASIWLSETGAQFIVIGAEAWVSADGNVWSTSDPSDSVFTDLLPGHDYAYWFDAKASYFTVAGDELKNGIQCVHYRGDASLGALYSDIAGGSAALDAELWVAQDGNYPVSGIYRFSSPAAGQAGSWGFSFDLTHVNDPANNVARPSNVSSVPT
jgi:hypothetical protein